MAHTPAVAPCCQRSPGCFLGASNEGFQAFWISCTAAAGVCALVSPQKDGRTDAQDKNSTVMDLRNKQPCTYEYLQNQQHLILLESKLMGSVKNFCKSQAYCTVTATTKNPSFQNHLGSFLRSLSSMHELSSSSSYSMLTDLTTISITNAQHSLQQLRSENNQIPSKLYNNFAFFLQQSITKFVNFLFHCSTNLDLLVAANYSIIAI
jgi:hypothetical protein